MNKNAKGIIAAIIGCTLPISFVMFLIAHTNPGTTDYRHLVKSETSHRVPMYGGQSLDYMTHEEKAVVTDCFAYPTNSPVTFVTMVNIIEEGSHTYPKMCYSSEKMKNGQHVVVRTLRFNSVSGAKTTSFVFPIYEPKG